MKRFAAIFLFLVLAVCPVFADEAESNSTVLTQQEKGLIDWTNNYVEAQGMAVAPHGTRGPQAKAMARRGAMLDLQRNLLEFLSGVQVDSETRMENFMAEDRVKSQVHGVIRNVEATSGEWDGEVYTIKGRIKLADVRKVIADKFPEVNTAEVIIYEDEDDDDEPEPKPSKKVVRQNKPAPRKSARYTGLVIDVRHLPYVPAMTFNVYDAKGRPVYGMSFVNRTNYLQSGLCAYFTNLHSAQDNYTVASSPITAKAVKLGKGNVDIYISNSDAAKVRASSPDFRKTCRVIIVSR